MIKIKNLSKSFRTEEIETIALNGVSMEVKKGEFVAIMGPSGCGKSTLLHILGLLDNPDEGSYLLDGEEMGHLKRERPYPLPQRTYRVRLPEFQPYRRADGGRKHRPPTEIPWRTQSRTQAAGT